MKKADDTKYEQYTLTSVKAYPEGGWELGMDGFCFFCPKTDAVTPKVGDIARLYGDGFGRPVRGLDINGIQVFYRTEAQELQKHNAWVREQEQKRKDEYEAKRGDYDSRVAALPTVFRERIERFRAKGDEWRYNYEPYELFVCEEAVKMAEALKTPEALDAWYKLPYEAQRKQVAFGEGHSGNTFGSAAMLAKLYMSKPEFVTKMHGAITPLVGCKAFGCH